jgi:hypothetical protein
VGAGRVTYEWYAVNGFHSGLLENSEQGTRIPQGRGNLEDENRSPALVGRVSWSPGLFLEIGGSVHHGAWNTWDHDGMEVDRRRNLTLIVADADAEFGGFRLAGEVVEARIELPATLAGLFAGRQRGAWGEVLRDFGRGWIPTMPGAYFSAGVRFEIADFDARLAGDFVRQGQIGFNFRPARETVLKLSYLRGQTRDRFNNASKHAGLRFSIATYF